MTKELDALCGEIEQAVSRARAEADGGTDICLIGVEASIRNMCEMVAALDQAQAAPYVQRLDHLALTLHELRDILEQRRGHVLNEMDGLNKRQKAAHAYRTSEIKTKPPTSGSGEGA